MFAKSFFIPKLPFELSKEQVRLYFSRFGTVGRVDFVAFTNQKGGNGRRGFVHYTTYNSNTLLQESIDRVGFIDIDSCDLGCQEFMVIRILENRNPVPETTLNLDQVANNTIFIGEQQKQIQKTLNEQEERIASLEKRLQEKDEMIERLLKTVFKFPEMGNETQKLSLRIPEECQTDHEIVCQSPPSVPSGKVHRKIVMYNNNPF